MKRLKKALKAAVTMGSAMLMIAFIMSLGLFGEAGAEATAKEDTADKARVAELYGKLPMYFIQNNGQVDEKVRFYEKGSGHATYFTEDGVFLTLVKGEEKEKSSAPDKPTGAEAKAYKSELVRLSFLNASKAKITAEGLMDGRVNYFIGKDSEKWRTEIPTYGAVIYSEVYEGVDVKFYGNNRQLEYDIIVKPGADPSNIKFSYEGIKELKVADNGDLEIILNSPFPLVGEGAKLTQKKPYIYQEINGKRVEVEGSFVISPSPLAGEGRGEGVFSYAFQLASYNPDHALIIDPVLVYSTYLGGSGGDLGDSIAVDSSGNAYVTGFSSAYDFPMVSPIQGTKAAGYDVFVTKINASGTTLVYSTYLGGNNDDHGHGIAVDSDGNAYVTGRTLSTNFPTASPIQGTFGGGSLAYDAFVTKINASGTALVYSTYLGGSSTDWGYGIAVDSAGNAYITGYTWSTNFPTASAIQGYGGGSDVFVTKINASGTAFVYSTYLGGSSSDYGHGIAVDSSGNAYLTGETSSDNFPTALPIQGTFGGGSNDAFVTKINASGTTLVYSTYLGGSSYDDGYGIAVDSAGNAYITGYTWSTNFPTALPIQGTFGGGSNDAFVTKINASGTTLVYSTYLGGSGYDYGHGIAVDSAGNAYVTGYTNSTNFPTASPIQGTNAAGYDAFVTKLNASGTTLVYSTYLGGNNDDNGYGIAVDSAGNAYVTGITFSTNFPTASAIQGALPWGIGYDPFVTKIADAIPNQSPLASAGADQSVHAGALVTLDGSASADPDGNYPLTYSWAITSMPSGSSAVLSNPTAVNPSFTADKPGDFIATLIVTDSLGAASASDSVLVSTANTPPVADAGLDQSVVLIGSTVQLNGTQSYDLDGDQIGYSWTLTSKPAGSTAALSNSASATPTFTADVHGDYIAQLVVSDPWAASAPDSVTVSFSNVKPVANSGGNQSVVAGNTVVLSGSGSTDANGDPLTYSWSLVTAPSGSAAVLSGADTDMASFIADVAGNYVVSLVVNDGFVNSDPSNASVTAISKQTAATAALNEAIWVINHLGAGAFKNKNLANALTNKINAVLSMIDNSQYAEAVDKLSSDILTKTDGCAIEGAPDKNDWIITCEAQEQVYPLIIEAASILSSLPW